MAKEKKGPLNSKPILDPNVLLTAEERAALDKEAAASVAADMKQDARDAYFAQQVEKTRRGNTPADQLVHVTIDCASYVPHIMIDHVLFYHGYTYQVPQKQAVVLYEQMQRSWQHQDEIDGRGKSESYRRPAGLVLGPRSAGAPTRGANGTVNAEI